MVINQEIIQYIVETVGKPILVVYNENQVYHYLLDSFTPVNQSNHIHQNMVAGKNIDNLIKSIKGFSHGTFSTDQVSILTKIEEITVTKFEFPDKFKWVKINQ